MQQGSQSAGESQGRRGTRWWATWRAIASVVPLGLVLAGVATFLGATLPAATTSLPEDSSGSGVTTSKVVVTATSRARGNVPSDGIEATEAATEPRALVAELEGLTSAQPAQTDGDLVSLAGLVQLDPDVGMPTTRVDRDDFPGRERPTRASRGGVRSAEAVPSPTPQPTPPPRREVVTYRVAENDTVSGLAERFGVSPQTIVKANDLPDPERLAVGQELVILPVSGVRRVVREGDTLLGLAELYGVIPEELIAVNGLATPDQLSVGQVLFVPEVSSEKLAAAVAPIPGGKLLEPTTYAVAPGDTLSGLASRFGLAVETLQWANPDLASLDQLSVGQELTVPPVDGTLHRVRPDDTVSGIAALHGASAAEFVQANGLAEPYLLSLGQLLVVPGGQPLPSALPSQPVAKATPAPAPAAPTARPQPTARAAATPAPPQPTPVQTRAPGAVAASAAAPVPSRAEAGGRIVAEAMKYKGYRYTWGGTSPQTGFDCSGFVWYVYRQAGVPITRDLWGQYNTGARIGRDVLQPGDLVFFQNTYKPGLSHDGIYVGGGQFIHAASENTGVIVSALAEPYWNARYIGATRPY